MKIIKEIKIAARIMNCERDGMEIDPFVYAPREFIRQLSEESRRFFMRKEQRMTREEKNRQIRKEARATSLLFAICVLWHVGFGYGLSGVDIKVFGLPLWWVLSTPGVFVVGVVGVLILLKTVFKNFSLEDEPSDGEGGAK